jgi:hypothetical protein
MTDDPADFISRRRAAIQVERILRREEKLPSSLDRWVSVCFAAICVAGRSEDEQRLLLFSLFLHHFSDAPDAQPSLDDTQAWAAYSVKLLLRALIGDDEMRLAAAMTRELMQPRGVDENP